MKYIWLLLKMVLVALVLVCIGGLITWICLPSIIQDKVIPQVVKSYQLEDYEFNVQHIGFDKTTLGPITLGSKNNAEEIRVENIEVRYSLWDILRAYWNHEQLPVTRIYISGINLGVKIDKSGAFELKTTEWAHINSQIQHFKNAQVKGVDTEVSTGGFPGVKVGRVIFRNTNILIEHDSARYSVKADCLITDSMGDILRSPQISGRLFTEEHSLSFIFQQDERQRYILKFNTQIDLARLPNMTPPEFNIDLKGECLLKGDFIFSLNKNRIQNPQLNITGSIDNFAATFFAQGQRIARVKNPKSKPLQINFALKDTMFSSNIVPIQFTYPISTALSVNLEGGFSPEKINCVLNTDLSINPKFKIDPLRSLKSEAPIKMNMRHNIECFLNNASPKITATTNIFITCDSKLSYDQTQIYMPNPITVSLFSSYQLASSELSAELNLTVDSLKVTQPNIADVFFDEITGKVTYSPHDEKKINLLVDFGKGSVKTHYNVSLDFNATRFIANADSKMQFYGAFDCVLPKITYPNIYVDSARISIPFAYPYVASVDTGYICLDSIYYDDQCVASIDIKLRQEGLGINLHGVATTPFVDGLAPSFDLKAGYFPNESLNINQLGAVLNVSLPEWSTTDSISLGRFSKSLKGCNLGGRVAVEGAMGFGFSNINPYIEVNLSNVNLENTKENIFIRDFNAHLAVEQGLTNWRTTPGQEISAKQISIKTIQLTNLLAMFRIEENGDLRIEGINLNWCGGKVSSLSTQLNRRTKAYEIQLYCNDLYLRDILQQLSPATVAHMTGDARVSGLIPIRFIKNKIILDPGYLHTVPGIPGRFELETTDQLMQGVDKGSRAYSQVDLAREAIKSFEYQWVKLQLGMDSDPVSKQPKTYKISLNIMGRPSAPLPFSYDLATGSFLRYTPKAGESKGIQQDIDLTINVNSDVQVMDVGLKFTKIMEDFEKNVLGWLPQQKEQKKTQKEKK